MIPGIVASSSSLSTTISGFSAEAVAVTIGDTHILKCLGNYEVDWGNGTYVQYGSNVQATGTSLSPGPMKIRNQTGSSVTEILFLYAQYGDDKFKDIHITNGSTLTTLSVTCQNLSNLETLTLTNIPNVTDMASCLFECLSLTSFIITTPGDTSNVINVASLCGSCPNLTDFPAMDLSSCEDFQYLVSDCISLTSFPAINTDSGLYFIDMFSGCTSLECLTNINTLQSTLANRAGIFTNTPALANPNATEQTDITDTDGANYVNTNPCPPLATFEATIEPTATGLTFPIKIWCTGDYEVDWGDGTYIQYTSGIASNTPTGTITIKNQPSNIVTVFTLFVSGEGFEDNKLRISDVTIVDGTSLTDINHLCYLLSELTTFSATNIGNVTNFTYAWYGCSSLTSFPLVDTSSGTNFLNSWGNCSSLTSFPAIDTSLGTDFNGAWGGCSALTSFPVLDLSNNISFRDTWYLCSSLTSFPAIDTSSGTDFYNAFGTCSALASIGSLNTVNGITFDYMFNSCSNLICLTNINTSGAGATTLGMFNGTTALTNPNATEQTSILAGFNYVNAGNCP